MSIFCKLFGHIVMVKVYTGEKVKQELPGHIYPVELLLYKWESVANCLRCGISTGKL